MYATNLVTAQGAGAIEPGQCTTGLLRLIVVNLDREVLGNIDDALWVWPHKVTIARDLQQVEALCRHLTPAAVLVGMSRIAGGDDRRDESLVRDIRSRLPDVPLLAVTAPDDPRSPGRFLEAGASAMLRLDQLRRPTLFNLIASVQPQTPGPAFRHPAARPELPWMLKQSHMLGALVCDVGGCIIECNACLANWLGYAQPEGLAGLNAASDLVRDTQLWSRWREVAGDTAAMLRVRVQFPGADRQLLALDAEIVAAPQRPDLLQAVFVDRTEQATRHVPEGPAPSAGGNGGHDGQSRG